MLTSAIVRQVKFCVRHARAVVAVFLLITVLCGLHAAAHFKINSDINAMLSPDLSWRKAEQTFEKAFHHFNTLYAVVDAPTPELTTQATSALADKLAATRPISSASPTSRACRSFLARGCCSCPCPISSAPWRDWRRAPRSSRISPPTPVCAASSPRWRTA